MILMAGPINALLVNSIMYNDIDGIQCFIPNHGQQGVLEAFKDTMYCSKRSSAIECILCIRMQMRYICGYESKTELYIAKFYFPPAYSRFAPPKDSSYLPLYGDILKFSSKDDIVLLGLSFLGLRRNKAKLLIKNSTATQAQQRRTIITFFSPITPYSFYKSITVQTSELPPIALQRVYNRSGNSIFSGMQLPSCGP